MKCCGSGGGSGGHTQTEEVIGNENNENNKTKVSIKKLITIGIILIFVISSILMMYH